LRQNIIFFEVKSVFKSIVQLKISKFFLALLVVLLVLGSSFAVFHSFSHCKTFSSKVSSLKIDSFQKSFFEKIAFANKKSSDQKPENCFLCAVSNFQNQTFLAPNLAFSTAIFYLIFALRYFDRVKLSYLFSSKSSRAPPVIS
jgi:hypothetical protein